MRIGSGDRRATLRTSMAMTMAVADRDSQASFSPSTKANIRCSFKNRCSIYLINLPLSGCQCAPLFDFAGIGAKQVGVDFNPELLNTGTSYSFDLLLNQELYPRDMHEVRLRVV